MPRGASARVTHYRFEPYGTHWSRAPRASGDTTWTPLRTARRRWPRSKPTTACVPSSASCSTASSTTCSTRTCADRARAGAPPRSRPRARISTPGFYGGSRLASPLAKTAYRERELARARIRSAPVEVVRRSTTRGRRRRSSVRRRTRSGDGQRLRPRHSASAIRTSRTPTATGASGGCTEVIEAESRASGSTCSPIPSGGRLRRRACVHRIVRCVEGRAAATLGGYDARWRRPGAERRLTMCGIAGVHRRETDGPEELRRDLMAYEFATADPTAPALSEMAPWL